MTFADGIGLRRIDHVGVAVPDLDGALALYVETLGGEAVHREVNEAQGVVEVMVAWPDGGAQVQLLAPVGETSPIAKFLDKRGPGLQQLAFTVDDVEAAAAALRERGATLLYESARTGTAGSRVNFVHPKDAGGVLVELVEPAAEAAGLPATAVFPGRGRVRRCRGAGGAVSGFRRRRPARATGRARDAGRVLRCFNEFTRFATEVTHDESSTNP